MYNEIPKKITDLRKMHFKSAQAFADALCVSLKTVQGWEKKENPKLPTLENLIAICELFGFDLDYFTGRLEQPTHDIQFIHEKTGLSVEAIRKLMDSKDAVQDSPLSDIIVHDNADRLLRVLLIATDEDEITWLDLDNIPRGLLSSYAGKPIDFSVGIGADVADFLASQELTEMIRDIRENHEKKKQEERKKAGLHHWGEILKPRYEIYAAKRKRSEMLERIEEDSQDVFTAEFEINDPQKKERVKQYAVRINNLARKIQNASYAEWQRGDIEREYSELFGEGEENDNGER